MRRQFAVAGIAIVVVITLFFVLLLRPVSSKISETRASIESERTTTRQLQLQLAQLQQAREDAPKVAARLAQFELLLPRTSDLPTFIRLVQEAADQSGMDLGSIAPSPPTAVQAGAGTDPALAGKGLFTISVSLTVRGGFFRLRSFLSRMENLNRIVQINSMSITPEQDPITRVSTLSTTISLTMYVVNPATPPGAGPVPPAPSPTPTPSPAPSPTPTGSPS